MIGRSLPKVDALAKARGEHLFPSDHGEPCMLVVRLVRAERTSARILSIEAGTARSMPGVACVLTHADVPGLNRYGLVVADQPVLCEDRARFHGEPVAIVAAETDAQARAAARAVVIDYVDLEPLLDPRLALEHKTPEITSSGNLCAEIALGFGDVDGALAASAHVASFAYSTGRQEHGYLETEAGCARFLPDGRLEIVCGGQNPFEDRRQVAAALGWDAARLRLVNPPMGGAFGGKEDVNVQIPLALVAAWTGRPCRMTFDRQESIAATVKRHRFEVTIAAGADRSGRLTGFKADLLCDTGAYVTLGPAVLGLAAEHCSGPYRFAASAITGRAVHTNTGNASAFRGFGNPQVIIGIERAMDELAGRCGLDPVEFRLRNLLGPGDRAAAGHRMTSRPTFDALVAEARRKGVLKELAAPSADDSHPIRRGVGVAFVWQGYGIGAGLEAGGAARLSRTEGGHFLLSVSAPDLGEGNLTSFVQIAAAELRCDPGLIDAVSGTTDSPNAGSTNASRSVSVIGNAVANAARAIKTRLDAGENGDIVEVGIYRPHFEEIVRPGIPHMSYAYGLQVLDASVDISTGEIAIASVDTFLDAGTIINPDGVTGQIEGGLAQGLGFAMYEDTIYQDGRVLNDRLATYIIPSIKDMPAIQRTHLVSTPDPANPLGTRGIAEVGLTPVAASLASALHVATGRRFDRFPILPEHILGPWQTQEAAG